jgi:hydrogenase maturation protease
MNEQMATEIANAVLYEGYLLYPYRASAIKNRHRFNFGVIVPRDAFASNGGERWFAQTECLVRGAAEARLAVRVRFLHLFDSRGERVEAPAWQEAVERDVPLEVDVASVVAAPAQHAFDFPGEMAGQCAVRGRIDVAAERLTDDLFTLRVVVSNLTDIPNRASVERTAILAPSLVSMHAILRIVSGGEFVSLLDPPADAAAAAGGCRNLGLWPVMVGEEHERDAMLASPIILYDYPRIAPESAGDFFDGTEIDEMLALRVMTMTDAEKTEARETDPRARALIDRTESLSEDHLLKLHGVLRGLRPVEGPSR